MEKINSLLYYFQFLQIYNSLTVKFKGLKTFNPNGAIIPFGHELKVFAHDKEIVIFSTSRHSVYGTGYLFGEN